MQRVWFVQASHCAGSRAENMLVFSRTIDFVWVFVPPKRNTLQLTWNWSCTLHGMSLLVIIRRDYLIGFIIFEVPKLMF